MGLSTLPGFTGPLMGAQRTVRAARHSILAGAEEECLSEVMMFVELIGPNSRGSLRKRAA